MYTDPIFGTEMGSVFVFLLLPPLRHTLFAKLVKETRAAYTVEWRGEAAAADAALHNNGLCAH